MEVLHYLRSYHCYSQKNDHDFCVEVNENVSVILNDVICVGCVKKKRIGKNESESGGSEKSGKNERSEKSGRIVCVCGGEMVRRSEIFFLKRRSEKGKRSGRSVNVSDGLSSSFFQTCYVVNIHAIEIERWEEDVDKMDNPSRGGDNKSTKGIMKKENNKEKKKKRLKFCLVGLPTKITEFLYDIFIWPTSEVSFTKLKHFPLAHKKAIKEI